MLKDIFNLGITMNDAVMYHTVLWKLKKFRYFNRKKNRQINYLVIYLVKCYFHEIFAKNEWVKHTVDFMIFLYHDFLKNFRENNFFSKEFTL